jgi:prevent-host-death family protein
MVTIVQQISKANFKARALEVLRQVESSGQPVLITDHGRPVVKIAPYFGDDDAIRASLRGTVLFYKDETEPVGLEDWEALR